MTQPSKITHERINQLQQFSISGLFITLAMVLLCGLGVSAQSSISLAIPETLTPIFRDVVLPRFQEANPDIYVELQVISGELQRNLQLPSSPESAESYLQAVGQFASSADVQLVIPYMMGPEATRAGYFLDLSPLVSTDLNLPAEDIVSAFHDAFSWDGGQWALPVMATPLVVAYDPAAFDAVGLAYPSESWVFDDFAHAARLLARDDIPGLQVTFIDLPAFFHSLTGQGFTDNGFPAQPALDHPDLAALVEQWAALEAEGAVSSSFAQNVPLRFTRLSDLLDRNLRGALLPGGYAGADVYGISASRGTNNPEAAYRLAAYLTTVPELTTLTPAVLPVRYSVAYDNSQWSLPEAALTLGRQALERALTPSDLRFGHYVWPALAQVTAGDSAQAALQMATSAAQDNVARAEALREGVQVIVPTVVPPFTDEAQAVTIRFGLYTGRINLPERGQWEAAIEEFVASDTAIERIELNFVPPVAGYTEEIAKNDCVFGYPFTGYPDEMLLVLDPLLDADPAFAPADVVGDVMVEMARDGRTYGLPVTVMPTVLLYQRTLFDQAGIPEPDGTWTVDQFADALQQLSTVTDGAPLFFDLNYSTPWELLMAAYGTPPVDYSTTPPSLHLTDPEVITTVRQVLDLAKAGYIHYLPMSTFFGSGASPDYAPALLMERLQDTSQYEAESYGLVTFPGGTQATPISFYSTSAFIFAAAPHPEACYRWLRTITRHPELFQAMPAYHSVIESPRTQALYGDAGAATFQRFAEMMEAPDRVFIRTFGLGTGTSMFMARAFDRYVLEDADLEAELALAQALTENYLACVEPAEADVLDCLLATDPAIRENIPARILGNR